MTEVRSILLVVDPRQDATALLGKVVAIARQFKARLELFLCNAEEAYELSHSYDQQGVERARAESVVRARSYLQALKARANAPDLTIDIEAQCDSPLYEVVVRRVLRSRPDLVIKALPEAHAPLDPNDWQLMRTCPTAIMLVGHRSWLGPRRWAAAVNASEPETEGVAQAVLQAARLFATTSGGDVDVVYAEVGCGGVSSYDQRLRTLCTSSGLPAERALVLDGRPEECLPRFAAQQDYDVLILGALAPRPGTARPGMAQEGILTSRLIDSLDCDFLLVKPAGYRSPIEKRPKSLPYRGALPSTEEARTRSREG